MQAEITTIKFGLIPQKKEEDLLKDFEATKFLLERELNIKVDFKVAKNYQDVIDRLKSNTIDLALLNGNQYAKQNKDGNFEYLATILLSINNQTTDHYNSIFIVHKDNNITSIKELKDKTFAFVEQNSGSGYIIPNKKLESLQIEPYDFFGKIFFLKKHDKVYGAIANKSIEGGVASNEIYEKMVYEFGDVFKIILILKNPK